MIYFLENWRLNYDKNEVQPFSICQSECICSEEMISQGRKSIKRAIFIANRDVDTDDGYINYNGFSTMVDIMN